MLVCERVAPADPAASLLIDTIPSSDDERDTSGAGTWSIYQVQQSNPSYADQGFGLALDISAYERYIVVVTNTHTPDRRPMPRWRGVRVRALSAPHLDSPRPPG